MKMKLGVFTITLILISSVALLASITFDPVSGEGFVGKGDVQLAFGWNNAQLQQNAGSISFSVESESETVTEVSWICTNSNNEQIMERARTTTTTSSLQGIFDSVARERNQVTGFNLLGYDGDPTTTSTSETGGPMLNSCPSGPWSLTTSAGDPELVSETTTSTLRICNGSTCVDVPLP